MRRGETCLLPAGPQGWPHLWIVVTQPLPATAEAVIVSVTTLRNAAGQTTILRRGDHPFIRHDSVVRYADARIVIGSKIDSRLEAGELQAQDPCDERLIDEVEAGVWSSPFTPKKILRFMEAHL